MTQFSVSTVALPQRQEACNEAHVSPTPLPQHDDYGVAFTICRHPVGNSYCGAIVRYDQPAISPGRVCCTSTHSEAHPGRWYYVLTDLLLGCMRRM